MVVGFNHNFRYKGVVYHVQTEDGGLKSPQIVTLLYRGGDILASKKTSYADITKVDRLEKVVEELMKDQHREMLRRLKDGDFDAVIAGNKPPVGPTPSKPDPLPGAPVPAKSERPPASPPARAAKAAHGEERSAENSLDEIILSYLAGEDERDR